MVIELEKIIELENSNPEGYSLILSKIDNFESKNEDVTTFLKRDAITHTKANRSKTFFVSFPLSRISAISASVLTVIINLKPLRFRQTLRLSTCRRLP